MWVFLEGNVPADLRASKPQLGQWGKPRARFDAGTCNMNHFFALQRLVINITLCGDWAGATFNADGFAGSCIDAVKNPRNYDNSRFQIRSVKVYQRR